MSAQATSQPDHEDDATVRSAPMSAPETAEAVTTNVLSEENHSIGPHYPRAKWRLLVTGHADGMTNMAVDEAIMRAVTEKALDLAILAPGIVEPFEVFGLPPASDLTGAVMGIAAHAPHPYAARLMIDFLMGDEKGDGGNAPWHVIGNWSTRKDVETAEGDIKNRDLLNTLPGAPSPDWVKEHQPKVRDFWLTIVI